jgi:thiol-disulfide isomerase/thioredoxin
MSTPSSKPSSRRLMLATAALAGLGGVGAGWWFKQRQPASPLQGEALPEGFWSHQFDTLPGTPLKLSSLQGRPLLLNFWATWCPPCVKEMPELDHFHQTMGAQGWQVVGLAIDGPTPVKEFLARTPVTFPIGLAGFGGTELSQALGNTAGGLPFSVLIDGQGRLRQRKMGATHFDELHQWAQSMS